MIQKLAKKARWWIGEDSPMWFPNQKAQKVICLIAGHVPIPDNCGIPEHDYCAWCGKPMPGRGH